MPTADQVAVSISADFREYDRQTQQSAAAFEQAVTGMGNVAEQAARAVEQAQRRIGEASLTAADRETQAAARSEAAQRRKETAQAAWILRAQRATAQFIANQEAEARKAEEAAQREARAAEEASRRTAAARNAAGVATGVVGPMGPDRPYGLRQSAIGGQTNFANVSFQLQDIFVQLAGGQAVTLVLAQQLPQLLMGFGSLGIAAGVAAAAIGLLTTAFGFNETAADRAKKASELFKAVTEATNDVLTTNEQRFIAAAEAAAKYTGNLPNISLTEIEKATNANTSSLEDERKKIEEVTQSIRAMIQVYRAEETNRGQAMGLPYEELTRQTDAFAAKIEPLLQRLSNPNLNPDEYAALARQIMELARNTEYADVITQKNVETVASADRAIASYTQKAQELQTRQEAVTRATDFWYSSLSNLVGAINGVSGGIGNLSGQLNGVIGQFLELARVRGLGTGSAYVEATGNDRLRELKEEGTVLNGTKQSNQEYNRIKAAQADAQQQFNDVIARGNTEQEKAALLSQAVKEAQDAYNQSLANAAEREKGVESAKKATTSAAERHAAAIDKSNNKLDQELELNQRLIAVYTQGAEARARVQAQYDAEREALNRNIKAGTDEYKTFVESYKARAEQVRQSEIVLDNYKKGEELTKSVMSTQERYNKTIEDYTKLRDQGAISEEAYLRLIRDLDNDTNGYAEGITAVGNAFEQSIQGAKSAEQAIINLTISLAKLLLQAALLGTGPLAKVFDAIAGTSGGVFNLAGSITGAALGTTAGGTAAVASPRAEGGQVQPGSRYTVAEQGIPEVFIPSVPGQIIPVGSPGGAGGSTDTMHVTQYINATGDKQIAAAIARSSRATLKAALNNSYKKVTVDSRNFGSG